MAKAGESSIVSKCARVMDVLSRAREPVSFSRILEETGFVKSSCHRILAVLLAEGLAEYNRTARTYRTGPRLRDWSRAAWRRKDLHHVSTEIMAELSETTSMNTALSTFDRDSVLYVRTQNIIPVRYSAHTGDHAPLHCTAAGKVFLAHMRDRLLEDTRALMRFERFTEHTITDFDTLAEQFPAIRRQGFAIARREETLPVTGVAAPVRDAQSEVAACLSLWNQDSEAPPEDVIALSGRVMAAARDMSIRLGWSPDL